MLRGRPEQDGVALPQTNSQRPSSGEQGWRPIWTAPVNAPVLVRVAGQSEPVVAVCDEECCWQVAWNGALLHRPILWQPILVLDYRQVQGGQESARLLALILAQPCQRTAERTDSG